MSDLISKNKVLFYTDCDFFAGCEKSLENIVCSSQITDKYDFVYAYRASQRYTEDLKSKKLAVRFIPLNLLTPNLFLNHINKSNKLALFCIKVLVRVPQKLQIFNLLYLLRQVALILSEKPDIVHINNGGYPGADSCRMMAIASGMLRVKKIVFTVNNMAVARNHILDRFLDTLVNKYVNYFVTASHAAARQLVNVRQIGDRKIQAIPNAVLFDEMNVDVCVDFKEEFNVPDNTLIIGSAGLLTKRKGYDILIKAAHLLPKDIIWRIYIFGDGEERDSLEKLIVEYSLVSRVFLPGFRESIQSYVKSFDIFVMSSVRNEDMPNAINEAMLLGKPIIGTNTSGIPEQIEDGISGYLATAGDIGDLAEKINEVLCLNEAELSEMGERSHNKYIKSFSYELAMRKYLDIYDA
ncbi:glycosyltransferase [Paracoccaceae bacterium]|nr:glycosyltransferase [Paracoccaceae bacterium]